MKEMLDNRCILDRVNAPFELLAENSEPINPIKNVQLYEAWNMGPPLTTGGEREKEGERERTYSHLEV